jgi:hypothetical protein
MPRCLWTRALTSLSKQFQRDEFSSVHCIGGFGGTPNSPVLITTGSCNSLALLVRGKFCIYEGNTAIVAAEPGVAYRLHDEGAIGLLGDVSVVVMNEPNTPEQAARERVERMMRERMEMERAREARRLRNRVRRWIGRS